MFSYQSPIANSSSRWAALIPSILLLASLFPFPASADRVVNGQQALYTFGEGAGNVVRDVSGVGSPLDLTIRNPSAVNWVAGGLVVNDATLIDSASAATKIIQAVRSTNALSVEAWVIPANVTQSGPARIFTLSADTNNANFTLGQGLWGKQPNDVFDMRLRSTSTSNDGRPSLSTPAGSAAARLTHVVYTRDASGAAKLYLDGTVRASTTISGNFSTWNTGYRLALANELTSDRPWLGEYRLVAIYNRALNSVEIGQNHAAGPDPGAADGPLAPLLPGFDPVNDELWDETAVRKVLHTFAYGGHATDAQIRLWADMPPRAAIVEMLTFDEHNAKLSPVGPLDYDRLDTRSGTLRGLANFWASADPANGVDPAARGVYNITDVDGIPSLVWLQAATSRGLNPVRQRVGLWETNYHLAVNRDHARKHQVIRYYDDIMSALARGEPYQDVLTTAATSAAIATQYGHRLSRYENEVCKNCNEDFAREYYQLFFGILGENEPDYHELTTIKNTAMALTGMSDVQNGMIMDYMRYGTTWHYPGPLQMLHVNFGGSQALQRFSQISLYAIAHPESLDNLPVMIIAGLADDNLDDTKIAKIRTAWASMPQKNLLDFLRSYAVSTLFHDAGRIRYLSSIDRNLLILNQMTLLNEENYLGIYSAKHYESEDVEVFRPRHNVFGGQTGREAADSADVFLANYNTVTGMSQRLRMVSQSKLGRTWQKDWAAVITPNAGGAYVVKDVAEWLWQRFLADGLKHFGALERAHVYALLASEMDFAYLADRSNPDRNITTADLQDPRLAALVSDLAGRSMPLNSADNAQRLAANRRVGQAVNFIVGTPYIYAEEGR